MFACVLDDTETGNHPTLDQRADKKNSSFMNSDTCTPKSVFVEQCARTTFLGRRNPQRRGGLHLLVPSSGCAVRTFLMQAHHRLGSVVDSSTIQTGELNVSEAFDRQLLI
jgi:hypothetical protein